LAAGSAWIAEPFGGNTLPCRVRSEIVSNQARAEFKFLDRLMRGRRNGLSALRRGQLEKFAGCAPLSLGRDLALYQINVTLEELLRVLNYA